jgi:hypothetical protein
MGHISLKTTDNLSFATKEIGLEVNGEKTNLAFMSYQQNAGKCHNIKIANKSFENLTKLGYLGMTLKKNKIE